MLTSSSACETGARIANLMLIGGGPHAKHFYMPVLKKLGSTFRFCLKAIVELEKQESDLTSYCAQNDLSADLIFVHPFQTIMPDDVRQRLDRYVREKGINGVIIAT